LHRFSIFFPKRDRRLYVPHSWGNARRHGDDFEYFEDRFSTRPHERQSRDGSAEKPQD
jgi:hypothetical protein